MSADHQAGDSLPEDLKSIESAFGGLTPTFSALDRDRLMYLAGRASANRSSRVARFGWPLATAALALVSMALGSLWLTADRGGTRIVYVNANEPSNVATATVATPANPFDSNRDRQSYLHLRNVVLVRGVDALPESAEPATKTRESFPIWPALNKELNGT
jgi:hypothetical protein